MSDYAEAWQRAFAPVADTFLRVDHAASRRDRQWLYTHLEGPVLDVGCGNAIDYEGFKKKGYTGLDPTPSFLTAAMRRGVPGDCLMAGDARHLPYGDKSYKSGYLKDVLLHWPQSEGMKMVAELTRVCENAYVAWGTTQHRCWLPSYEPAEWCLEERGEWFFYCRYDLAELERTYRVTQIPYTTITRMDRLEDL